MFRVSIKNEILLVAMRKTMLLPVSSPTRGSPMRGSMYGTLSDAGSMAGDDTGAAVPSHARGKVGLDVSVPLTLRGA
jgi:hypothetical protein